MVSLTNAEAALLGLLSEESMYPYQIEQQVKFRDMRYWTELSMSSIYKLLRKLEKEALVDLESRISPENRVQKLYSITDLGKAALKAKITLLLSVPEHTRWQVDIGTNNLSLLSQKEASQALTNYRSELAKLLQGYHDLEAFLKGENCPQHRLALARRPQFLLKAELEWLDSYLADLNHHQ